ncbi:hypothetical protein [Bacillus cereus group sp. BfR-BA-01330]|uniref:hypothetical protein n=1 Tax=Bacillus cereus group sp. BfR-BA-01330 TaxID=2920306 RepID=UPI001F578795
MSQDYIWTKECQEAIKRSEGDIKEGCTKNFSNVEELLKHLHIDKESNCHQ